MRHRLRTPPPRSATGTGPAGPLGAPPDVPRPQARNDILYAARKSLLDTYAVNGATLGLSREPFDRVVELKGFELTPVEGAPEVWQFQHARNGLRGRLLDVTGFLYDVPVALSTRGRAYMVTRQDFTLALVLPGVPKRLKLNEIKYSIVPRDKRLPYPNVWPAELITRVIRFRWRNIVILNETYLLKQIGLRGSL